MGVLGGGELDVGCCTSTPLSVTGAGCCTSTPLSVTGAGCWVLHFDSAQCDRCWVLGDGLHTSLLTTHYLLLTLHASLKNLQRPNNIVLGNDMVVSIAQIYQHRVVIFMNQF